MTEHETMKIYTFTEARMLLGIFAATQYFGVTMTTVVKHIDEEFSNCGGFIP